MTIAQQLNVKVFPFEIKNKNGKRIYYEEANGGWCKNQYDTNGIKTNCEIHSNGNWEKLEYDANGYIIRHENSRGYWIKREYDTNGNEIYFEDSKGFIRDKRQQKVELSLDDIAQKFGINVNQLKIKK
jgi:hypothetical protein